MKNHLRTTALLLAAVMILALLSGCMDDHTQIMIGEGGRTTFVNAAYLAREVIDATGKTPEEYYSAQIEAGGTLGSMENRGHTYWGIVPTPQFYDSFEDFCKAVEESDRISAYIDKNGFYNIVFTVPTTHTVAQENGEYASYLTPEMEELMVYTANLNISGRWLGINTEGRGREVVDFLFDDTYNVLDLTMPCADEEYTVHVWGTDKIEKEEGPIDLVRLEIFPSEGENTTGSIRWKLEYDGEGTLDISDLDISYWISRDGDRYEKLDHDAEFEPGMWYAVRFIARPPEGSYFAEDCEFEVEGVQPDIDRDDPNEFSADKAEFWYMAGRMPGGAAAGKPVEKIEVEIAAPKAGAAPRRPSAIDPGSDVLVPYELLWLVSENGGGDRNDWDPMAGEETFEEGKFYAFYLVLTPSEGYVLSDDPQVLVNGKELNDLLFDKVVTPGSNGGETVAAIFHSFGKLGETSGEKPPIGELPPPQMPGTPGEQTPLKPLGPEMPAEKTIPFTDVAKSDYFYDSVVWAFNSDPQITDGTSATTFSPAKTCTRGQVVTFLWRACGCPEPKTSKNPFTDVKESDYFYKPVLWAVECGITDGTTPTTFSPANTCKNSHILTFIWRAEGEPDKTGEGSWYTDALNWAEKTGMLKGSYTGKYGVNADCPRANVVYYLYSMR
ncbi:MAG: S-layer homology domain-containing protein [Firmicutes bacterium]|nr:S-layer homology domain-containing protein [Bacillota bacterium]